MKSFLRYSIWSIVMKSAIWCNFSGAVSLFRRVAIPKGHYSKKNMMIIIPKKKKKRSVVILTLTLTLISKLN